MSSIFTDLQKVKDAQTQTLHTSTLPPAKAVKKPPTQAAQEVAQNVEQVSKPMSKDLSKSISQNAVEELVFALRKTQQAKINGNIPLAWKEKLDALAFRHKVGKYELVTYIVGVFLGEVDQPQT